MTISLEASQRPSRRPGMKSPTFSLGKYPMTIPNDVALCDFMLIHTDIGFLKPNKQTLHCLTVIDEFGCFSGVIPNRRFQALGLNFESGQARTSWWLCNLTKCVMNDRFRRPIHGLRRTSSTTETCLISFTFGQLFLNLRITDTAKTTVTPPLSWSHCNAL